MFADFLAGTALISATVIIHALGLVAVAPLTIAVTNRLDMDRHRKGTVGPFRAGQHS